MSRKLNAFTISLQSYNEDISELETRDIYPYTTHWHRLYQYMNLLLELDNYRLRVAQYSIGAV